MQPDDIPAGFRDVTAEAEATLRTATEANGYRFNLVPFDRVTLDRAACTDLVQGIIPREGLVLVWGKWKSGKSFKVFDIAMHIALGWEYRGRKVKQGPVVWIACEGEQRIGARVEAFRQRFLDGHEGSVPFHMLTTRLDLIRDHELLIREIRAQVGESPPAAITLDTLNKTLVGSENSDEDMGAYVKAAEAIREAFHCAVIVIHHCGHNGERPRGHSSLLGALDAEISITRIEGDPTVTLRVVNMKDGPEGTEVFSQLEVVNLGNTDDGQEITSCVVIPAEAAPSEQRHGSGLNKNQQTMLSILHEAGKGGLSVEEWNRRTREVGIGEKRKQDLYDIRTALKNKHLVYEYDAKWFVRK